MLRLRLFALQTQSSERCLLDPNVPRGLLELMNWMWKFAKCVRKLVLKADFEMAASILSSDEAPHPRTDAHLRQ